MVTWSGRSDAQLVESPTSNTPSSSARFTPAEAEQTG
jgi:hypothetical protein